MPTYDYRCDHCDHVFSAIGGFDDPPLAVCPRCGEEPRRLIGATAIVFKGSGWYKTDSRSAPKDGGEPAPGASAGPSAEKPGGPTPSAPTAGQDRPAESKPAESKEAQSKPAQSKPAESKPATSKPAASKSRPASSA